MSLRHAQDAARTAAGARTRKDAERQLAQERAEQARAQGEQYAYRLRELRQELEGLLDPLLLAAMGGRHTMRCSLSTGFPVAELARLRVFGLARGHEPFGDFALIQAALPDAVSDYAATWQALQDAALQAAATVTANRRHATPTADLVRTTCARWKPQFWRVDPTRCDAARDDWIALADTVGERHPAEHPQEADCRVLARCCAELGRLHTEVLLAQRRDAVPGDGPDLLAADGSTWNHTLLWLGEPVVPKEFLGGTLALIAGGRCQPLTDLDERIGRATHDGHHELQVPTLPAWPIGGSTTLLPGWTSWHLLERCLTLRGYAVRTPLRGGLPDTAHRVISWEA